jgi:2-keto-4-pentenoate hydratase
VEQENSSSIKWHMVAESPVVEVEVMIVLKKAVYNEGR